jgi:hypothetical protein
MGANNNGKQESPGASYSRRDNEGFQLYGFHLGWHALTVLGGRYLLQSPISERHYENGIWEGWLAHF